VPFIATIIFVLGILGLFYLDRRRGDRTSKALWIPVLWLSICESRAVSLWLDLGVTSSPDAYLEGSPVDRLVFLVLLAAGVIALLGRTRRVGSLLRQHWPLALFFLYCLVSVFWSDYPGVALKRWTKAIGDLVMVLIVVTDKQPLVAARRLITRTGFVLLPLSILFIKYFLDWGRAYSPWSWTQSFVGVTTNKNELGMLCLLSGLGFLWCFLQALHYGKCRGQIQRGPLLAHGAGLAMTFGLLYLSSSATSLSCFLMGAGLMIMTSRPGLAKRLAVVHLLVLSMLLVTALAIFVAPNLLSIVGRDPTLTGRTDVWRLVLGMQGNPLFGTGFESFWLGARLKKMWSIYWWHPNEAHDGYLEIFLNLGWVGLILFALMVVTEYRRIISAIRKRQDAATIRLAYFAVALTYNFTESAFRALHPVWIFFLWALIAVPKSERKSEVIEQPRETSADFPLSRDPEPVSLARSGADREAGIV
jgi:exopolysaccharide production protein ExoQ